MTPLTDRIAIGDHYDEMYEYRKPQQIGILNVACDLPRRQSSSVIEYMHVGLIDGPGNTIAVYCAAILALDVLLNRRKYVLICCHGSSRPLAVAVMYLTLKGGKVTERTFLHHWRTWDEVLEGLRKSTEMELPEPHGAHKEAADKIPYGLLEQLL